MTYEELEKFARDAYRAVSNLIAEVRSTPEPTTPWSIGVRERAVAAGNEIITRWEKSREAKLFPKGSTDEEDK